MDFKAPRGTHDIFGKNADIISFVEQKAKEIFKRRGFEEVFTPIFEDSALFNRAIGQSTDIVEKEMYVFEDRKGRKLCLRPEGTAGLARAFIENSLLTCSPPGKFFYCGEMFRYERPQSGRYRQFRQIGAEFFGNLSPCADAEIIIIAKNILESAGIISTSLHINSLGCQNCRPLFKDALLNFFSSQKDLCQDCLRRIDKNPLRLLDCKIDSPKFLDIPKMSVFLCADCKTHFETLKNLLKSANCDYIIDDKLVRGLDYYTRTVFEIRSADIGAQDAIAAGGRYDKLVKELGGHDTAAVGFALGVERVCTAAQKNDFLKNNMLLNSEKVFIAVTDEELFDRAFAFSCVLAQEGFKDNKNISIFGPISGKSLTNQLKFADKIGVNQTIIFAKTEFDEGKVLIKDMKNQLQKNVLLSELL